ncbi:MAG: zinc-ribbon domain-containing protein [Candidatus Helarchaeota archaeon]
MKLQQINRGKSKYYHVYLPKNVVEHALHWHRGDTLEYQVINNSLVLKKLPHPTNRYLEELSCPICFNHCVVIKILRNVKRNEFIVIARCPIDHIVIKKFFPMNELPDWKFIVKETVTTCDLCGSDFLEEQFRRHSETRKFTKIRYMCRECHRARVKIIADEIIEDRGRLPELVISPIIQKNREVIHKLPPHRCPVCQEEVPPDAVFCGQCGTLLINGEY